MSAAEKPASKLCRKCGRVLPMTAFARDGRSPCDKCRSLRSSLWFLKNKDKLRAYRTEYMRKWRQENPDYKPVRYTKKVTSPEQRRKYRKRYRDKHLEQERANSRAYYAKNRERLLAQKRRRKFDAALNAALKARTIALP